MNEFFINDANSLLCSAFSCNNYAVINGMACNKLCIIFCSGNGIWYPDTNGCFRDTIIVNDRYEWRRTASHVIDFVERIIFIRDLHKCWYASGINDKVNSIDKLVEFLNPLCHGYRVILTGNSAGGYIASLLGYKLNADFVLNWSGQCNIYKCDNEIERYFFLKKYTSDASRCRYYNIVPLLQDNRVPIYYFYPSGSEQDIKQYNEWLKIPNVFPVALNSRVHGAGVSNRGYFTLLLSSNLQLQKLYGSCAGKVLDYPVLEEVISELPMAEKYSEFVTGMMSSADKTKLYRDMLLKWVRIQQHGKNLFRTGKFAGLIHFAVYGRGGVSKLLIEELKLAHKSIRCIVESNPSSVDYEGYPVIAPCELHKDIDAVIAVPCYDMDTIRAALLDAGYKGLICGLDELLEQADAPCGP